jgi:hypothetical protein
LRNLKQQTHESTRRTAQTGTMARKSIVDSDGPSTADVSANEDVEMQDQDQDQDTKMSGFKKFGVSATRALLPVPRRGDGECFAARTRLDTPANSLVAVLPGYTRLHSTLLSPSCAAPLVHPS